MAWELREFRNPDDTDLIIAIPHVGNVRFDWALSFRHLDIPPGVHYMTSGSQGQPIHIARNVFVSEALKKHAKHIFFLDSDVEIPHNGLTVLYEVKKPIVSGVYSQRSPPYNLAANINRRGLSHEMVDKYPNRLIDVHEVGAGALLIDMRVFQRIASKYKKRWFCMKPHAKELGLQLRPDEVSAKEVMVYTNKEATEQEWRCKICGSTIVADFFKYTVGTEISAEEGPFSEDYYFCHQARTAGFPISIHTGVFCNHEMPHMKIARDGLVNPVASAMEI